MVFLARATQVGREEPAVKTCSVRHAVKLSVAALVAVLPLSPSQAEAVSDYAEFPYPATAYTEPYRGQFHFSSRWGNTLHDEGKNAADIKGCRYVIVRGNTLSGFPNTAIRPAGSSAGEAVVLHPSASHILIQGNSISRAGRGVSILSASTPSEYVWVKDNHFQDIRNLLEGNGQAIRIASARKVWVEGNTAENTASDGLMLAADGAAVEGLVVRSNTLRGGSRSFLLRLGPKPSPARGRSWRRTTMPKAAS
jgi:hypothetical protein